MQIIKFNCSSTHTIFFPNLPPNQQNEQILTKRNQDAKSDLFDGESEKSGSDGDNEEEKESDSEKRAPIEGHG